jgi:hypothetical protein
MGLVSLGVVALCAAVFIVPYEAIFGDASNNLVRDAMIATAVIVFPIYLSNVMDHAPRIEDYLDSDGEDQNSTIR